MDDVSLRDAQRVGTYRPIGLKPIHTYKIMLQNILGTTKCANFTSLSILIDDGKR